MCQVVKDPVLCEFDRVLPQVLAQASLRFKPLQLTGNLNSAPFKRLVVYMVVSLHKGNPI